MEVVNDPDVGEDILLVFVDGPLEAFVHRLDSIIPYGVAFAKALSYITGGSNLQYFEKIFLEIYKECKKLIEDVEEIFYTLQNKGIHTEILVADLPPVLIDIGNNPNSPDYLQIVVRELSIAVTLLHDKPYDPTLALITADRAVELFLKGRLGINRKIFFPELLKIAKKENLLDPVQVDDLGKIHVDRNECQHKGVDIDFQKALHHIKKVIDIIADKVS